MKTVTLTATWEVPADKLVDDTGHPLEQAGGMRSIHPGEWYYSHISGEVANWCHGIGSTDGMYIPLRRKQLKGVAWLNTLVVGDAWTIDVPGKGEVLWVVLPYVEGVKCVSCSQSPSQCVPSNTSYAIREVFDNIGVPHAELNDQYPGFKWVNRGAK